MHDKGDSLILYFLTTLIKDFSKVWIRQGLVGCVCCIVTDQFNLTGTTTANKSFIEVVATRVNFTVGSLTKNMERGIESPTPLPSSNPPTHRNRLANEEKPGLNIQF